MNTKYKYNTKFNWLGITLKIFRFAYKTYISDFISNYNTFI